MIKTFLAAFATLTLLGLASQPPVGAADYYALDSAHSAVSFKISHLGLSWTHGRFNEYTGSFTLDADPARCVLEVTIKADSIDTNSAKRDEHLRSPDFFNVKQYPTITFKSTQLKAIKDGYEVTGDFTMHGVKKSITFPLVGGRMAEFPKGVTRTGYSTELILKRSEYGMEKFAGAVGDDVHVAISFEATKK